MGYCLQYCLYDAFSNQKYGGSQAAIVLDATSVNQANRIAIAKELGYPATVYVSGISESTIDAQFYSTVAELPMCGHGTVALMSCLSDRGLIDWQQSLQVNMTLALPHGDANVIVNKLANGKTLAMLEVRAAEFRDDNIERLRLCKALGLSVDSLSTQLPIETAVADFTHLMVPLRALADMALVRPNFADIVSFYADFGIETITVISTESNNENVAVRIRDFCPAVGVAESAAAGTTNAAVAGFLFKHKLVSAEPSGVVNVTAEQGIEINRPSEIHSRLHVEAQRIDTQWVGGVASKVASGYLEID